MQSKKFTVIRNITLPLSIISLLCLAMSFVFFELIRKAIITGIGVEKSFTDAQYFVVAAYMVLFIFHLFALAVILMDLSFFKRDSFIKSFIFFVSIISLLMLFGDYALLSDISKEYIFGFPDEFIVLYSSQGLHFLFIVLIFLLLGIIRKNKGLITKEAVVKDESIFINAQYIGLISGISGILFLISCIIFLPLWAFQKGVGIVFLAVIPYIIIIIYWLVMKCRERIREWYDEKQFQDLTKSSLITLGFSILFTTTVFIITRILNDAKIIELIWFPFYVYFSVLIFSSSILAFSRSGSTGE
ncbi:MAG: hypothetical protein PHU65_07520 [Actinomycetota bacterium]|nr:hypothetical protein [Actinomycetota bacterium]